MTSKLGTRLPRRQIGDTSSGTRLAWQHLGVQARSRVTRSQFRHPLERIRVPAALPVPAKSWSVREWDRIQAGYQSSDMDDRWHALVENDHLYLHRSWTGFGI
jgi:hypothetical protein